jgi:MFS family permease
MTLIDTPRGRRTLFALLYFSEGAPMGFLWWALPVRLREAGMSGADIASLLSVLVLPWAFKFVWAPLADSLDDSRFTLRTWIVTAQVFMTLTLLPLLSAQSLVHSHALTLILVLHACAAATQDVGIDTLAIRLLPENERGAANGWMQIGLLGARALFGGGALLVANRVGDAGIVIALIGAIWISSTVLLIGVPQEALRRRLSDTSSRTRTNLTAGIAAVLTNRTTWLGLAFAATAGAGFKSATAMAGTFMLDRGADTESVGIFFLAPAVAAMAIGAWTGGRLADRYSRRATVAVFESAAAVVVAALGVVALTNAALVPLAVVFALFTVLYLAIGFATAASYALFMDLTTPETAATQFCVFMAGINLCEAWSTRTFGGLLAYGGYPLAFVAMASVSIFSLALIPFLGASQRSNPTV